jgi:hypothetical protein
MLLFVTKALCVNNHDIDSTFPISKEYIVNANSTFTTSFFYGCPWKFATETSIKIYANIFYNITINNDVISVIYDIDHQQKYFSIFTSYETSPVPTFKDIIITNLGNKTMDLVLVYNIECYEIS